MVGMTRAHMTDPHIVRKIIEKREDDIRPCVGANYCLDRIYQGGAAYCIHNAATGRELTMPHDIPEGRESSARSLIVGAGPAGLEAARVAGERGHEVTVLRGGRPTRRADPADCAERAPSRDDQHHRLAHGAMRAAGREVPLQHLGRSRHRAGRTSLTSSSSRPAACRIPRCSREGNELVVSTWDIISGDVKPGSQRTDLRRRRRPCCPAGCRDHRQDRREGRDHDP